MSEEEKELEKLRPELFGWHAEEPNTYYLLRLAKKKNNELVLERFYIGRITGTRVLSSLRRPSPGSSILALIYVSFGTNCN